MSIKTKEELIFKNIINELTYRPLKYEQDTIKSLIKRGLPETILSIYTGYGMRENYWTNSLVESDYTFGIINLAGWSSYADRSRALGKYSDYEEWSSNEED